MLFSHAVCERWRMLSLGVASLRYLPWSPADHACLAQARRPRPPSAARCSEVLRQAAGWRVPPMARPGDRHAHTVHPWRTAAHTAGLPGLQPTPPSGRPAPKGQGVAAPLEPLGPQRPPPGGSLEQGGTVDRLRPERAPPRGDVRDAPVRHRWQAEGGGETRCAPTGPRPAPRADTPSAGGSQGRAPPSPSHGAPQSSGGGGGPRDQGPLRPPGLVAPRPARHRAHASHAAQRPRGRRVPPPASARLLDTGCAGHVPGRAGLPPPAASAVPSGTAPRAPRPGHEAPKPRRPPVPHAAPVGNSRTPGAVFPRVPPARTLLAVAQSHGIGGDSFRDDCGWAPQGPAVHLA
jgi:hypothetical protein